MIGRNFDARRAEGQKHGFWARSQTSKEELGLLRSGISLAEPVAVALRAPPRQAPNCGRREVLPARHTGHQLRPPAGVAVAPVVLTLAAAHG